MSKSMLDTVLNPILRQLLIAVGDELNSLHTKLDTILNSINSMPMSETEENEYMTIAEAAKFLSVSERTIERYLDKGTLRRSKLGRLTRLHRSEVKSLVDTLPNQEAEVHDITMRILDDLEGER